MSITGALFSGVSGLAAQGQALGVISDNISNVSTIGYKGVSASFATLVTVSASENAYTPGGVRARPLQHVDQQGLLQSTTSLTDIAMAGAGLFVVNEAAVPGSGSDYLFTRAGSFRPDSDGYLVNTAGYYLQGWPLDSTGALPANTTVLSSLETVNIANLASTAVPTTTAELGMNLPSTAANGDTHSVTVQVFDSLGNAHDLQVDFVYNDTTVPPQWDIAVQDPTLSSTGAVSGTVAPAARSITFNGDGTPATITFPPVDITWTATTANPSSIAFDLGTLGLADGVTQFAGEFAITFIDQDGAQFGAFTYVSIGEDGVVTAHFDNGQLFDIYQLPIAMFPNFNGLEPRDGNAYLQTREAGNLLLVQANTGGAGIVASSALESSTVDLATEFTNMIVTQRAYSASAKIITTADEMLEELIRISR
ncbi:MAG: flagellar hook protein FlgE [Rhodospirillales bacterium]|nr:flagellar hook protein FlgE [Rhodospirillales bacterium]MDH3916924.1 flagellar hook protein FlgE [Rhodospirillales bacterium]MDH3967778.1 flagellar hook protein FlgE [Rhodospirillales bacterium]